MQVPNKAGRVLDCSEPLGMDCSAAHNHQPGQLQSDSIRPATFLAVGGDNSRAEVFWLGSATKLLSSRAVLFPVSAGSAVPRCILVALVSTAEAHGNLLCMQTLTPAAPLGPLGWIAAAGFVAGFAIETVADLQKFYFKSAHPDKCGSTELQYLHHT